MTVNTSFWQKYPIAARDQEFNADEAIARIAEWAAGSVEKFNTAFLWRNAQGPANNKNSYRLPIADVINGKLTLIPHAVFTAAAILSGAHGGLEGVVGEDEKKKLKGVVTQIYEVLQKQYGDPRTVPPWLRGGNKKEDVVTSGVNERGWDDMPVADAALGASTDAMRAALWQWADGDIRKYRQGFLWWDHGAPEEKLSYKLPIATVVDGRPALVAGAVGRVAAMFDGGAGVDIPDQDMDAVKAVVQRVKERIEGAGGNAGANLSTEVEGVSASAIPVPIQPPSDWFLDPKLNGPTPLAVTADGQVLGHLALWNTCHVGIQDQCVMAPRTATGYRYFRNGTVLTASGETIPVGRITLGTGHASTRLGWIPAADHYDNTGTAVAVVASGEDQWGIWVAGSVVPGTPELKVAELRRSPLSGDWRRINGNLELVAALAVNTPGFPIVAMTASGEVETLCAAGMVVAPEDQIFPEPSVPDETLLSRLKSLDSKSAQLTKDLRSRRLKSVLFTLGGVPDDI